MLIIIINWCGIFLWLTPSDMYGWYSREAWHFLNRNGRGDVERGEWEGLWGEVGRKTVVGMITISNTNDNNNIIYNRKWSQPQLPSTDEWIIKMYVHNDFFSATKKTEIMSLLGKWIDLKNIILSEATKAHYDKCCVFSLKWNLALRISIWVLKLK